MLFLQIAAAVVVLCFCAIVVSSVAFAIHQQWTKQPKD